MLGSKRRDNSVDSRLKYSLGWPVLKGMRFHMPFSRSLQHSDRLRHVESTVLSVRCVCVLFYSDDVVRLRCLENGLEEEKKVVRSGKDIDILRWDFFGAKKLIGSNAHQSFTARSLYQTTMSLQRLIRRLQFASTRLGRCAARNSNSDLFDEY